MKSFTLIILLVLIAAGIWFAYIGGYFSSKQNEQMKNSELMKNGNETSVITEDNVAYTPGAHGYFARPKEPGSYPGVVMVHEWWGLNDGIKEAAKELAKEGYYVLAVDLYGGEVATDAKRALELVSSFDQKKGTENMRAAARYLKEQGAGKLASLGWCFGGKQSLELAISGEHLDATVLYYGSGMATSTDALSPISWPVLGIFGEEDASIPVETVHQFESSLNKLGVHNEIHIYPGVGHAFANPSGANYAPEATKDAWEKTLAFLKTNLK